MDSVLKSPHLLLKLSMPPVMLHLMTEAVKPEPDFAVLARAISLDPVLASTVLSLVNSPFYGLTQKVTDLQRAAVVLGSREIIKIAFSVAYQQEMQTRLSGCGYDMRDDWRMMLWSAIAAEELARIKAPGESDQAYLCALLKDVSLLLIHCVSPEELPPGQATRVPVTVLHEGQLQAEEEHWGMHHAALTQVLLNRWSIPGDFCEPIRHHHDMDGVDRLPPLAQVVALATRWAEVELGGQRTPFDVVKFEFFLRETLAIGEQEMETLRNICKTRYQSMLNSLDMPSEGGDMYCQHTMEAMQSYYFMSMDLLTVSGGLFEVSRNIGRHLRLNWDVEDWDLALKDPHGRGFKFYSCCSMHLAEGQSFGSLREVPWNIKGRGAALRSGGIVWGELRIDRKLNREGSNSIMLYLRFLSQAFELYAAKHAVIEEKALVLDSLPMAVAWLSEDGLVRENNSRLSSLLGGGTVERGKPLSEVLREGMELDLGPDWDSFVDDPQAPAFSRLLCMPWQDDELCFFITGRRKTEDRAILFLMEDLSELSGAELQSIRQLDFLENVLDSMQDVVLTVDARGMVRFSSDRDYADKNLFKMTKPSETYPGVWGPEGLMDCSAPVEAVLSQPNGNLIPCELVITPLNTGHDSEYLVMLRDLSTVRRLEAELKRQAMIDGLTGLFNHYQFHSILDRELRRSKRTGRMLGLLFMDLDGFKEINDTQGHQVGDDILSQVGRTLLTTVRKGTDFPCRYGGDEFAVVFTEVDADRLVEVARRVTRLLAQKLDDKVTFSAGLSMLRKGDTTQSLLGRADRAAYSAKAHGGGELLVAED